MKYYWQQRETAQERETDGDEIVVAEYPEWTFRIGRKCDWNAKYQRAVVAASQNPKAIDYLKRVAKKGYVAKKGDVEIDRDISIRSFANGLLLGWSGVTDVDGDPLDFENLNKVKLLTAFPDIYAALNKASSTAVHFIGETQADDEKEDRADEFEELVEGN